MHSSLSRWVLAALFGLCVGWAGTSPALADDAATADGDGAADAAEECGGSREATGRSPSSRADSGRTRTRCVKPEIDWPRPAVLVDDEQLAIDALKAGAVQLAVSQGIHGAGLGLEICALAGCRRERQWASAAVAGSVVGFGTVLLATGVRLDPRLSLAMRYGNVWGTASAYLLFGATSRFYDESSGASGNRKALIGAMMAGQIGGLLLGNLAWRGLRFDEADADAAFGAAMWASGLAGLLAAPISGGTADIRVVHGAVFAVGQLGLIGGYALSRHAHLSRRRVWLIQLGGLLGGATGTAIPFLLSDVNGGEAAFYSAAGGALAGMILVAALTRRMDGPPIAVDLGFRPAPGGAVATVGGRWR
ncbi:MAG: hypothetical protein R3F39_20675 [Myxococcota bacterium]